MPKRTPDDAPQLAPSIISTVPVRYDGRKYDIRITRQVKANRVVGYLLTQGKDQISVTLEAMLTFIAALEVASSDALVAGLDLLDGEAGR